MLYERGTITSYRSSYSNMALTNVKSFAVNNKNCEDPFYHIEGLNLTPD